MFPCTHCKEEDCKGCAIDNMAQLVQPQMVEIDLEGSIFDMMLNN